MIQIATDETVAAITQFDVTVREIAEISNAIAAVSREIVEVRAVAGETDAGAEAALAAAVALQEQAVSLKGNVADFLQSIRSAA
jgi:methyl-accepting chemotaxis protein